MFACIARRSVALASCLTVFAFAGADVYAATICGGPVYHSATQTGYLTPTLPFAPGSTAGNGAVVGYATELSGGTNLGERAFRWDAQSGAAIALGVLGANGVGSTASNAYAINSDGTAVGSARQFISGVARGTRAVRWDATSNAAVALGDLGTDNVGSTDGTAYAINASGVIAGFVYKYASGGATVGRRAVRWDAGSNAAIELGHIGTNNSGITQAWALGINDAGTIVGYANKYAGNTALGTRAVRWDAGTNVATELGHIGTSNAGSTTNQAFTLNAAGTAVGIAYKYVSGTFVGERAVRWDAGGTAATELGILGTNSSGSSVSYAFSINNAGITVGYATKYANGSSIGDRAVRWNAGATAAIELGNLGVDSFDGFTMTSARAINNAGLIAGTAARFVNGSNRGMKAVVWGADNNAFELNLLLSPAEQTYWDLQSALDISDTYWVSGIGNYNPNGTGGETPGYQRMYLLDVIRQFGIRGDANRDNAVGFADLLTLAQHYGESADARWDDGDFTGDGAVNFADLLQLAQNYGGALSVDERSNFSSDFAADWSRARLLVPEPGSAAMLVIGITTLCSRRRGDTVLA